MSARPFRLTAPVPLEDALNEARYYVYVLFRENGVPFYIGKGCGGRWAIHEWEARRNSARGHRLNIIRRMMANGIDIPKVKLHEGLREETAHQYEIALIAAIGRRPHGPLVNLSRGGDGASGVVPSPETRSKLSEAGRGRKHSPATLAKMSASQRARELSPEAKANIVAAHRGKLVSVETRAKQSMARRGKLLSAEHREKIKAANRISQNLPEVRDKKSAAARDKPKSAEHVAKVAAAHRGMKRSAETRARIAAAAYNRTPEHAAKIAASNRGKTRSLGASAKQAASLRAYYERRRQEGTWPSA